MTKTLNELMVLANKYLAAHNSNDLTPARTNLESALRELIADAERYRWLRQHGWSNETGANILHISPECWNENIDAQRTKASE